MRNKTVVGTKVEIKGVIYKVEAVSERSDMMETLCLKRPKGSVGYIITRFLNPKYKEFSSKGLISMGRLSC